MGYLLKTKEEGVDTIKMYYSEPTHGYYASDVCLFNRDEYDKFFEENPNEHNNFVFMNGWCDTSESPFSKSSYGYKVDDFTLSCILQGKKLDYNTPVLFQIN